MIDEKWLKHNVTVVYDHWEARVPANELRVKCIERTMEMIRRYRENENPERYRAQVEALVDRKIRFNETGEKKE